MSGSGRCPIIKSVVTNALLLLLSACSTYNPAILHEQIRARMAADAPVLTERQRTAPAVSNDVIDCFVCPDPGVERFEAAAIEAFPGIKFIHHNRLTTNEIKTSPGRISLLDAEGSSYVSGNYIHLSNDRLVTVAHEIGHVANLDADRVRAEAGLTGNREIETTIIAEGLADRWLTLTQPASVSGQISGLWKVLPGDVHSGDGHLAIRRAYRHPALFIPPDKPLSFRDAARQARRDVIAWTKTAEFREAVKLVAEDTAALPPMVEDPRFFPADSVLAGRPRWVVIKK